MDFALSKATGVKYTWKHSPLQLVLGLALGAGVKMHLGFAHFTGRRLLLAQDPGWWARLAAEVHPGRFPGMGPVATAFAHMGDLAGMLSS